MSPTWNAAFPEFICACILLLAYYWHPFSIRAMGFLMLLHYCFWALLLWKGEVVSTVYGNIPPPILLLIFPLLGIVGMLLGKAAQGDTLQTKPRRSSSKVMFVALAVSVVGLSALWLPGRGYSLIHAKDSDSVTIEMSRGNCQMGCPVYTVTIHGNGPVDYVGQQYVRARGPERSVLTHEQIHTLLEGFDEADFFSLEDRAFAWGYHTSWVFVKIIADGKTKEVRSDSYHIGSKSGSQAKFVQAAAAIDKVVGTARWVNCGDGRCPP
jgi:hypothetical protein